MSQEIDAATKAMREKLVELMESFKIPGVDIDAITEGQLKNIEAISRVGLLTAEGAAAIAQRQLEVLRNAFEHPPGGLRDANLSSQQLGEFASKAFETALAGTRELAEMTAKSNTEVFDVVRERITENLELIRTAFLAGRGNE